jgi:hypothetical protein
VNGSATLASDIGAWFATPGERYLDGHMTEGINANLGQPVTEDPVKIWFRAVAAGLRFSARGSVAHRQSPDVIQVLDLQRSNYGRLYYINLGIALKSLGARNVPREEQCHIRVRLDSVPDVAADVVRFLDLDQPMDVDERIKSLELAAGGPIRDFVEETSSMSGLRARYRSGGLHRAFIHHLARAEIEAYG